MMNYNQLVHIPYELRITNYPRSFQFYDFIIAYLNNNVSEELHEIFDSEVRFRYLFRLQESRVGKVFNMIGWDPKRFFEVTRGI